MKHRPVGLEYMGSDFKSILLSFPLYYLDTSDAREFMHYVVTKKFTYPVGIAQAPPADPFLLQVFPNPVKDACNITFTIEEPGPVQVSLISLMGRTVSKLLDRKLERGIHSFRMNTSYLTPGLYEVFLQQGEKSSVRKELKIAITLPLNKGIKMAKRNGNQPNEKKSFSFLPLVIPISKRKIERNPLNRSLVKGFIPSACFAFAIKPINKLPRINKTLPFVKE
jgi:hypothetical protein